MDICLEDFAIHEGYDLIGKLNKLKPIIARAVEKLVGLFKKAADKILSWFNKNGEPTSNLKNNSDSKSEKEPETKAPDKTSEAEFKAYQDAVVAISKNPAMFSAKYLPDEFKAFVYENANNIKMYSVLSLDVPLEDYKELIYNSIDYLGNVISYSSTPESFNDPNFFNELVRVINNGAKGAAAIPEDKLFEKGFGGFTDEICKTSTIGMKDWAAKNVLVKNILVEYVSSFVDGEYFKPRANAPEICEQCKYLGMGITDAKFKLEKNLKELKKKCAPSDTDTNADDINDRLAKTQTLCANIMDLASRLCSATVDTMGKLAHFAVFGDKTEFNTMGVKFFSMHEKDMVDMYRKDGTI